MTPRTVKVLVKTALTVVILGAMLWLVGIGRIGAAIKQLDATLWIIAFVAFFLVHGLGTFKWRFFIWLAGARLGLRDGFRCYAAGLFANLCLPTMIGGDVLRAGLAMAATRQKTAVVLGSLLDRCSDFVSLVILAGAGFLLAWNPRSAHLGAASGATNWTPFLVAGGLAVLGFVAAIIVWRRWHAKGRARKIILELLVALRRIRRRYLLALVGLLISTSLQFTFLLVHRELGTKMGMPHDLAIWVFIWPVAKLVAMVPITIGGLGVREAAFWRLSALFGISESVAVATSLAWQAVMVVGGLISGVVWVLLTWRPEARIERAERRAT